MAALNEFRAGLESQGLLSEYDSPADLAYKVRSAIEGDLAQMGLGQTGIRRNAAEHARPRARRAGDSLVVENRSNSVTAQQFWFDIAGVWPASWGDMGDDEPVHLMYEREPIDLLPDSQVDWPMMVFGQSPPQLKVTMHWQEDDEPREETQIVAL